MTAPALFLAALLLAALVLFITGWLRADLTALLVMLCLLAPVWPNGEGDWRGLLEAREAFAGFGSPAVLMLAGMFVLSAALVHTGAAAMLGERLLLRASRSLLLLQATVFVAVAMLSTMVSNTTTVLVAMPLVLSVCQRRGYPPSKVLMGIAFASLLGGQWTLIGTRSNILIADFANSHAHQPIPFFAYAPVAALVFAAALAWFLTLGRRLLPSGGGEQTLAQRYEVTEFLTEVLATPGSDLIGKTIADLDLVSEHKVRVLQVMRRGEPLIPDALLQLESGDVLIVQGRMTSLTQWLERSGLEFKEELAMGGRTLKSVDLELVEAVVAPHSELEGRSLEQLDFNARFGVTVLAIGRRGHAVSGPLAKQRIFFGDSLLVVGHSERVQRLAASPDLVVADRRRHGRAHPARARVVLALLLAVAAGSASGWLDPAFAIVAAGVAAVLLRTISLRDAYEAIDWKVVVVVGGMIPFGTALEKTGTDMALASAIVRTLAGASAHTVLASLLLVVVLLTQVLGNAAVAVLIGPLAWRLAQAADASPLPFLVGAAVCTSASFMTPIAHEANLLVMGPGGYRGRDYLRTGLPLALITWAVTSISVPWFYPLN